MSKKLSLTIPSTPIEVDGQEFTLRMMPAEQLQRYAERQKEMFDAVSTAAGEPSQVSADTARLAAVAVLEEILPDADPAWLASLLERHPYSLDELMRVQKEFQHQGAPLGNLLSLLPQKT